MKLDEEKYKDLKNFKKVRGYLTVDQRLYFLKIMSDKKWGVSYKTSYEVKRKRKHRSNSICLVCDRNPSFYQHHIILLKNGGPDASWNRIKICENCHREIHPWLR